MKKSGGLGVDDMGKTDPTDDPEFKRVLGNLLKMPHKPHAEMKVGKSKAKRAKSPTGRKRKAQEEK